MSILVRFTPNALTAEQYDGVISKLEEQGDFPPDGLEYHVCFGTDGSLRVSEIWDSQEKFQAFGERLMPILSDAGIDSGEPEVIEVHNSISR